MELVKVNGCEIAVYRSIYEGEPIIAPIILIHGFTGSAQIHWRYEINNYSELFNTDVIAFDLPGHGASPVPKDFNFEIFLDVFLELLKSLNIIGKINLIGASFGGTIANSFVLRYPNKVQTLTIISSLASSSEGLLKALRSILNDFDNFFENNDVSRQIKILQRIHGDYKPPYNKLNFLYETVRKFENDVQLWNILEDIKTLDTPTLVIHSDKDYLELNLALKMFMAYKNAKFAVLPNAEHLPNLKYPKLVEKFIKNHIFENK